MPYIGPNVNGAGTGLTFTDTPSLGLSIGNTRCLLVGLAGIVTVQGWDTLIATGDRMATVETSPVVRNMASSIGLAIHREVHTQHFDQDPAIGHSVFSLTVRCISIETQEASEAPNMGVDAATHAAASQRFKGR